MFDATINRRSATTIWQVATERYRWLFASVVSLFAVLPRLVYLKVPFERDEGAYAYIADIIGRGGLPYVNAFDNKPPLIYYFYDFSLKLFGHSIFAPRITAALFTAVSCFLVWVFVHRQTKNIFAATFAAFLLGISSSSPEYTGFIANTEIFTLPWLVGGALLLAEDDPKPGRFFFAGLLFGIAFMIKQPAAFIAAASFFATVPIAKPNKAATSLLFYTAGFFLPVMFFAGYFGIHGALGHFWAAVFAYNVGYMAGQKFTLNVLYFVASIRGFLISDPAIWVCGFFGFLILLLSNGSVRIKRHILSLLCGCAISIFVSKNFLGHYFIFILPFLAIAAGIGLGNLTPGLLRFKVGNWIMACALIASLVDNAPYFIMPPDKVLTSCYGSMPFYQSVGLGKYLKAHADNGTTAYVIGSEPQVLFYSGFTSPTRFFYYYPLATSTVYLQSFRKEAYSDLERDMPSFVLWVNHISSHMTRLVGSDPFMKELFNLFKSYKLIAISTFGSDNVTANVLSVENRASFFNDGSILVFQRPNDMVGCGTICFGDIMKRIAEQEKRKRIPE